MSGLRRVFALPVIGYGLRVMALVARLPRHLDALTQQVNVSRTDEEQAAQARLAERQSARDAELSLSAELDALRRRVQRLEAERSRNAGAETRS